MTQLLEQEQSMGVVVNHDSLLDIRGLRVDFPDVPGAPAIDGMDLRIGRGEIVALVGESGSGKSLTALTVMGLLPPDAEVVGGEACRGGEDLLSMPSKRRNQIRGHKVAMLFQQPKVMLVSPAASASLVISTPSASAPRTLASRPRRRST